MNISIENILLVGSLLLLVSIFAGKTSYKFGVPTLLLFLAVGMLAGSEYFVSYSAFSETNGFRWCGWFYFWPV